MSKFRLGGVAALTALTASFLGAVATPAYAGPADETLVLTLTNATRTAAGVAPLTLDSSLSAVAREWASSMAAAGGISHNSNLKHQIDANWSKLGENVGYGGTVQAIYEALLNSPSHLRNIVDPEFERIGIGVVFVNNTVWLVQNLLTPMPSAPAATAPVVTMAPVAARAPAPSPTTTTPPTTLAPPATTTTAPPAPVDTVAAAASGLPLRLVLMVQHVPTLGVSR